MPEAVNHPPIDNKWRIGRRIGAGSFGEIFHATGPDGEPAAVKFERKSVRCPQLRHECKVYRELADCVGVCNVHHFGSNGDYLTMVLDLLGPSLEELFTKCGRRFSLKTTLQLADQMLERIDMMHMHHLIHRDIKPANFTLGAPLAANGGVNPDPRSHKVYVIDFGLSKRYRHPRHLAHLPYRDGRSLTGTPRYASISNHMGIETSRRDDLESIGYILIYFLVGKLPWQGLRAGNTVQKHQLILDKKMSTSIEDLCVGCPRQFADYMRYCRALKFDAKPNIAYLRGLFRDLYKDKYNSDYTFEWDWERQPDKERRASKEMQGGSGGGEGGAAAAADGGREGASRRNGGAAEDGAGQKPLDTAGMARSGMMNSTPQMLTQVPVESRERSHRLNPEGGKLGSLGGAEKSGMPSLTGKGGGLQPMQPLAAKLGAPVEPPTQTAPPGDGAEELPAATTLRERRSSKDHRSKKVLQEAQQAAQAAQQGAAPTVLGSSVVKQADAGEVQRPKTSGGLVSRASSGGGGGYGKIMKWRSLGSNVHDTGATETKGGEGEATQAWGTGGGGGGGGGGRQRLGSGDSPTGGERPSTSGQSTSHLTAGTRSLMRYRRNRGASDGDASGNRPKTSGAGAPNAGRRDSNSKGLSLTSGWKAISRNSNSGNSGGGTAAAAESWKAQNVPSGSGGGGGGETTRSKPSSTKSALFSRPMSAASRLWS